MMIFSHILFAQWISASYKIEKKLFVDEDKFLKKFLNLHQKIYKRQKSDPIKVSLNLIDHKNTVERKIPIMVLR